MIRAMIFDLDGTLLLDERWVVHDPDTATAIVQDMILERQNA